jgi:hypothetical protein
MVLDVASADGVANQLVAEEDAAIAAIRHPGRLVAKPCGGLVRRTEPA